MSVGLRIIQICITIGLFLNGLGLLASLLWSSNLQRVVFQFFFVALQVAFLYGIARRVNITRLILIHFSSLWLTGIVLFLLGGLVTSLTPFLAKSDSSLGGDSFITLLPHYVVGLLALRLGYCFLMDLKTEKVRSAFAGNLIANRGPKAYLLSENIAQYSAVALVLFVKALAVLP